MKATAATIAAAQWPDGGIPDTPGGTLDPWNHVEAAMGLDVTGLADEAEAAYRWLAAHQNDDGSWYAGYRDNAVTDSARDANFTAYIAVGLAHHSLLHGDALAIELWPVLERALGFVLTLQRPGGEIAWRAGEAESLRTGCSSIHHALRLASELARRLGRPGWDVAADRLRDALIRRPEVFTAKPHSMDWYYPVLGSALTGDAAIAALAARWDEFVVPGLGVRCVHHEPWVTGGETCELALTLATRGRFADAATLLENVERLRHTDGSYWTGYQFRDDEFWPPDERTTWTSGAYLLARAALSGERATTTVFGERVTRPLRACPG